MSPLSSMASVTMKHSLQASSDRSQQPYVTETKYGVPGEGKSRAIQVPANNSLILGYDLRNLV